MDTQNVINEIKNQIPQLKQIQYDLNSQLHYINKVCQSLEIQSTRIEISTKITQDHDVEAIISKLKPISNLSRNIDLPLIRYFIGTRLGLYDGASLLRRNQ